MDTDGLVIQRKKEGDPGVTEGLYIPPVLGRGPHLVHSELAGESFHYGSSAVRKSCVTHRFCWPLGHAVALRIADCQLHPCTLRLRTKPTSDGKHSICPEHAHSTHARTHPPSVCPSVTFSSHCHCSLLLLFPNNYLYRICIVLGIMGKVEMT